MLDFFFSGAIDYASLSAFRLHVMTLNDEAPCQNSAEKSFRLQACLLLLQEVWVEVLRNEGISWNLVQLALLSC